MVENKYFSIGAILKNGWRALKKYPFTWTGAILLSLLIYGTQFNVIDGLMGNPFSWNIYEPDHLLSQMQSPHPITRLVFFIYFLIYLGFILGFTNMGLRVVDGQSINILHLFSRFYYVFHYLIACFVYGLITIVGFLLLFFPGAIWGAKYSLYPYFIIDKGAGPFHALKLSSKATKGFKWDIFAFMMITFILSFLGFFIIGIFFVAPVLSVAWATIYRKLTTVIESEPVVVQEPDRLIPAWEKADSTTSPHP